MTREEERRWGIIGTLVILLSLLISAFNIGRAFGSRGSAYKENAADSLNYALEVIYNTEQYGGDMRFDDVCDDVTDSIYDALAWLEKSP